MQLFEDLYGSDMLNYHNSKIDFFSALEDQEGTGMFSKKDLLSSGFTKQIGMSTS